MSDGRYNFTYGFVEARMWLPPGTGTPENWAAFWVNGKVWPEDGEIDIMETLGGGGSTRGGAKTASSPHYFILNHGLNGSYPIKVPSTLKIDYVRHWQ